MTGKRILYVDGASRGNPGRAAIGVALTDEHGNEIESIAKAIGTATNNEAEYRAVLYGMELAEKHRTVELEIRTDSELLARQLKGSYQVRAENLKPLWDQARRALKQFKHLHIVIIPRSLNKRADALANQALDAEESLAKGAVGKPAHEQITRNLRKVREKTPRTRN